MEPNSIADALVYAVAYINLRENAREDEDEDDVDALESIAGFLSSSTPQDQDFLAAAAERALASEQAGANREEFVDEYETWMEAMFGEPWVGNQRDG